MALTQQSVGFEKSWILYGDLYYNHIIRFSIAVTAVEKRNRKRTMFDQDEKWLL